MFYLFYDVWVSIHGGLCVCAGIMVGGVGGVGGVCRWCRWCRWCR